MALSKRDRKYIEGYIQSLEIDQQIISNMIAESWELSNLQRLKLHNASLTLKGRLSNFRTFLKEEVK